MALKTGPKRIAKSTGKPGIKSKCCGEIYK
jgi:hypothetical protein